MEQYTLQQHLQIIQMYYQGSRSIATILCRLFPIFGRNNYSTRTIERLVHKFKLTYLLHNVPVSIRQRNARSAENIAVVRKYLNED